MKLLSEELNNTLTTAGKTDNSHAVSPSSSTRSGGEMIIAPQQTQTPSINDRNLIAYLKHTLKLPVTTYTKTIFDEQYGASFQPVVKFGEMNQEQMQQAQEALRQYMQPMDRIDIIKLITRLQIICPEREKNNVDVKARTYIWIEELQRYPADVVNMALRQKYRWFPSLAEVLDYCDNEVAFRKLVEMGIRCVKNH